MPWDPGTGPGPGPGPGTGVKGAAKLIHGLKADYSGAGVCLVSTANQGGNMLTDIEIQCCYGYQRETLVQKSGL